MAVAVEHDDEAEQLVYELGARGYEVVTIIELTNTKRLATARLRRTEDRAVFIDLLFASSGIERELAAAAVRIDDVPVGRVGDLLALKVLSETERRLQDRIDIQALTKVATDEDWHTAEAMVRSDSAIAQGCFWNVRYQGSPTYGVPKRTSVSPLAW